MAASEPLPTVHVLITDLDNTLYDWFAMWHASFGSLLAGLVESSGIPQPLLEREIRSIHQRHGTSEYSYLVNEIPSLRNLSPDRDLAEVYASAIHRFRSARKSLSKLYPGVLKTLLKLKSLGIPVVGYTESREFYTTLRLKRLGLDGVLDLVYSPNDHDFPTGVTPLGMRSGPPEDYRLSETRVCHTPEGVYKPSPVVLSQIVKDMGVAPERVAYVGDSLVKDVAMAQDVGAIDVHAAYGVVQNLPEYDLLRRVSHWTDEDVRRESTVLHTGHVHPSHILADSFDEIIGYFDWKPS